jgi:prepilin-type processing-associated H-X9-DG protein
VMTTLGIGVKYWWDGGTLPDYDRAGYKTSVIVDPSDTLILAENPKTNNIVGNEWPSTVNSPDEQASGYGGPVYALHGKRYNYLLADGHTELFTTKQTIGRGSSSAPRGKWTITPGD